MGQNPANREIRQHGTDAAGQGRFDPARGSGRPSGK